MNKALLAELQRQFCYPSITLLCNTKVGMFAAPDDIRRLQQLLAEADRRLVGDVSEEIRHSTIGRLRELIEAAATSRGTEAVAVFASPEHSGFVRLMDSVRDRVVIDNTFATRDLVVDAQRTALFRVITVSGNSCRLLVGDRKRLAEQKDEPWPLHRHDETACGWLRAIKEAFANDQSQQEMPTVIAGTPRAARQLARAVDMNMIGIVAGNHDRTSWVDLHQDAWPLVSTWIENNDALSMLRIDAARGANRYAGGIDEVWELANRGLVDLMAVERSYEYPARLVDGHLIVASDVDAPDVIDDAVDELIELVLLKRGRVVIVADGKLAEHDRIASVLRY